MMPISIAGQTLGVPPAFTGRAGWTILDDLADCDSNNLYPGNFNGSPRFLPDSSGTYADRSRMAVYAADVSGGAASANSGDACAFFLTDLATASWQWGFYLSSVTFGGANKIAWAFGLGNGANPPAVCSGAEQISFYFSTDTSITGPCGAVGGTNFVINCRTRDSTGALYWGEGPSILTLTAQWNTARIDYDRSAGTLKWYLNGAQIGSANNAARYPTARLNPFGVQSQASGVAQPDIMAIDYYGMTCAVNR